MRSTCSTLLLLLSVACSAQDVFTLTRLDLKPTGEDFAPTLVDSGFVMTSLRDRDQVIDYTEATTGKPLADLYSVRFRNGKPGRPRLLDGTLCTPLNDGPAAFSDSGSTVCITRNQDGARGRRSSDRLGLFFAHKAGSSWSETQPFALNSDAFSVMHATFSADGQRMYFASDMPGGEGGTDLYVCQRQGDDWGTPRNLGVAVNTPANELFPFAGGTGQLFFSSDRTGGLGKLDIYKSVAMSGEWTVASALPAPVNSGGNDLGYCAYADGLSGLFSSDRENGDHIYRFTRRAELFRDCTAQQKNNYCYDFEDQGSFNTDTLPLRYEWDLGDGTRISGLQASHCFAKPGNYTVKLNIVDTLTQSVFFNEASYDLTIEDVEQAYINTSDSIPANGPTTFDIRHTNLPGFTAAEVHWDLGDSTFATGDAVEHTYAQQGTYLVRLDLIGPPDASGNLPNHCVTRSVHAVNGLTQATAERITRDVVGFDYQELPADELKMTVMEGEDVVFSVRILASEERVSMDDARFLPIRKFYPVIERFDPSGSLYTYSVGAAKDLKGIYGVFAKVRELKYTGSEVMAIHADKLVDMADLAGLPLEALNGSVLRVNTVLFRTGQSTFDDPFRDALGKVLAIILQHPQVGLVIEAHTDDVGTEESNLLLSEQRAQRILEYFVAHGIASGRLTPIGFGENRPLADNAATAGRTQNRRVEFRLTVDQSLPTGSETAHP